jgi:hypothetical protein
MPEDQDQDDDRYRDTEKPKKNTLTHRYLLFHVKAKTTSDGFAFPLIRHSRATVGDMRRRCHGRDRSIAAHERWS